MSNNIIDHFMNSNGFDFPRTSRDLKLFDQLYKDYKFEANVNQIDPENIVNKFKNRLPEKKKNIEIHKRTVLAAEIVFQLHQEWSLGHLKLQKLVYLCMNLTGMELHVRFLKQAMGPYDPQFKRSINKQFVEKRWFEYRQECSQKFLPLEKAGEHRKWFDIYFKDQSSDIEALLEKFRKTKTEQIELIATIYACWKELLLLKKDYDQQEIIRMVYEWSPEKEKFKREKIKEAINWMLENRIYPVT